LRVDVSEELHYRGVLEEGEFDTSTMTEAP
jgi:hypothetical protein